jgi:hypothetical protein
MRSAKKKEARFDVLTAVFMKSEIVWVMMPCQLVLYIITSHSEKFVAATFGVAEVGPEDGGRKLLRNFM